MKILIIYDSVYGNTEKIAKAIGAAVAGEVKVLRISEAGSIELNLFDALFIGSPTQGGKPTQPVQDFLGRLSESVVKGVKVAAFDTRLSTKWVGIFGYAAGKIGESLKRKDANLLAPPEAFFVKGTKGPLADGELERAAGWAKTIMRCIE